MSAWTQITVDMVEATVAAPLFDAIRSSATGVIDDRFNIIRDRVVARIRATIESRPSNQVETDPTLLPPELVDCASWLIIEQMIAAMPQGALELSDSQKQVIADQKELLGQVRTGDYRVSRPLNPLAIPDVQANAAVQVTNERARIFTRDLIAGL